jgi:MOSC domain-containing protein YiiM
VGERWRIGGALLEVAKVRIPCNTFQVRIAEAGGPDRGWIRRFVEDARPGPYLRVLEEGDVTAGDPIDVVHRPGHGITVSHMFRALTTEPRLLGGLAAIDGLATSVRSKVVDSLS